MVKTSTNFSGYRSRRARFENNRCDAAQVTERARALFDLLAARDIASTGQIPELLGQSGLRSNSPRMTKLAEFVGSSKTEISVETIAQHLDLDTIELLHAAFSDQLAIDRFDLFRNKLANIFSYVGNFSDGVVAHYIPELAGADPNSFALAACSIDGQQVELGEHRETFSLQSTMKPLSYALALSLNGESLVHQHVGREPSGRKFNELSLNPDNRPHNPMINSGAIMCSALIHPSWPLNERFDLVQRFFGSAAGSSRCAFDKSVYESELETADSNFALAELLSKKHAFPESTDVSDTLDLYFRSCAMTVSVNELAIMAATLANGGVCPTTGHRVIAGSVVRNTLSLMLSCGLYDFSGEFAFSVGLPAKSGVSGALMIVVPGVCGFGLWSPPLDRNGNSVRGIEFSKRLVETFPFHIFSNVTDI